MADRLTVGSLFAGIGGLELGLERAGMEVKWQVEINEFCRRVLEKHWPEVPRYGDIREVRAHNLEPVDLICGGFPCQPVSLAGKRKGQDDERWLWPEFFRVVREMGPRYVFVENVPGLLAGEMGDVLRDLASIGYDAEWESIPASAVGAPHLRYRVFILAYTEKQSVGAGLRESQQGRQRGRRPGDSGGSVSDSDRPRLEGDEREVLAGPGGRRPDPNLAGSDWWAVEPDVGRVADGVPSRVDRLRALGNAVVPQVAEWIGRRILTEEGKWNTCT